MECDFAVFLSYLKSMEEKEDEGAEKDTEQPFFLVAATRDPMLYSSEQDKWQPVDLPFLKGSTWMQGLKSDQLLHEISHVLPTFDEEVDGDLLVQTTRLTTPHVDALSKFLNDAPLCRPYDTPWFKT